MNYTHAIRTCAQHETDTMRAVTATDMRTAMETVTRISAISADSESVAARAEAIVEELRTLIPMDAAEIVMLNPITGNSDVVTSFGYNDRVLDDLHSEDFHELMRLLDLPDTGRPTRMRDLPGDPLDNWAVSDVLLPAGYREGLTMCLRTSDGRFTGVINLSTTDPAHPSDLARDVIAHLCKTLGNLVDPLSEGRWVSMLLGAQSMAVGLDAHGTPVSIPGVPSHQLLQQGTELLDVAHQSAHLASWSSFVWPDEASYYRVRVVPCREQQPLSAVVSLDAMDLGLLSLRELEVLTLAADGMSNAEIAQALVISPRTVATHVEHILGKVNAPNRAAAVAHALRQGLILGKVQRFDH